MWIRKDNLQALHLGGCLSAIWRQQGTVRYGLAGQLSRRSVSIFVFSCVL